MKWASTVTEEGQLDEAVAQASRRVLEDLGELPDLVVVFASAHYGDRYARLSDLIAENLREARSRTGRDFTLVSRSDSTLRGHFPDELDALAAGLGERFDA